MKDYTGRQIERYQVIACQGMGGMAVVYHAFDTRLERDVALKLIRADAIPAEQHARMMVRFEREARSQSKFSHQNIVPIYDYGDVDGLPFLVMAYIPGGTLKDKVSQPIPPKQALAWVIPVADALGYAHRFGVIHRDVKPSNILVHNSEHPVLTDFGIAKLLESEETTLTGTNIGVGTPEYMAPEQWLGKSCEASDQYALGILLYELLTGVRPYTGDTPVAVALKQKREPLVPPSALVPNVPQPVENMLLKVLSYSPADRYKNMCEFYEELKALLEMTNDPAFFKQNRSAFQRRSRSRSSSEQVDQSNNDVSTPSPKNRQRQQGKPIKRKTKAEQSPNKRFRRSLFGVLGLGLVTVLIGLLLMSHFNRPAQENFNATDTSQVFAVVATSVSPETTEVPTQMPMVLPSPSSTPMASNTFTITPSPTEQEVVVVSRIRELDDMEMVFVPAGEFIFGTGKGGYTVHPIYVPFTTHNVYVDAFWIDKYEVTNHQYEQCVAAGACNLPYSSASRTRTDYYGNDDYRDHPVIWVERFMAVAYCEWVGMRLPTEAEWEKAARGTDGREYPWGNVWTTGDLANIDYLHEDTIQVGSFPEGASPYGTLDMYGNVWEWVSDWYHPTIYATQPPDNPTGPTSGEYRMFKGGSYRGVRYFNTTIAGVISRGPYRTGTLEDIGFRCVMPGD